VTPSAILELQFGTLHDFDVVATMVCFVADDAAALAML